MGRPVRNAHDNKSDDRILQEASDWFVRLDSGRVSAAERRAFDVWLSQPAHRDAFTEVEKLWREFGAIETAVAGRRPRASRWKRAAAGFAVAASLAFAAVFVFDLPTRLAADALTETGQMRTVDLPDGSTAVLNTASAIAIDYSANVRTVRLLRGEASFTARQDASRPFTVEAGGGSVRALGTEFVVKREAGHVRITDVESQVAVRYPSAATGEVVLSPGEQVAFGSDIGIGQIQKVDADAETAWRRGKLVFVDRPLGSVIGEINRYHRGAIQIVDPAIADRSVSGVFETNDPVTIVDALETSLGFRSTRLTGYVILLHR